MLVEPVSFTRENIKCCSAITCFIVIMKTTQNSPSSPFFKGGHSFPGWRDGSAARALAAHAGA